MKTLARIALIGSLLLVGLSPLTPADPVVLPQYGFQIEPLDGPVGQGTSQALMVFLPSTNGFSPNVNVQIQPYADDLKSYSALSKKQFDQLGLKLVTESYPSDTEWVTEYSGTMQGNSLHWYARAILSSGKVYLVTATAKDEGWADVSPALKKCVDSFKLK